MRNLVIRVRIRSPFPDFGPIDAVQLKIQQIEAEMTRQHIERVDRYCRGIIEYCDKSIKRNR